MSAVTSGAIAGADIHTYLREHEGALRLVTDALPVGVAFVDPDGAYVFINRAYEQCVGLTLDDVRGKHVSVVVGPAAYEKLRPFLEAALKGQRVETEKELPFRHGATRRVHVTYFPRVGPHGRLLGLVAYVVDVTGSVEVQQKASDRSRQEARALRAARAQLGVRRRLETQQRTLYELTLDLSRSAALEDVANVAVTSARTAVGASAAVLYCVSEGASEAVLVAAEGAPQAVLRWNHLPLDGPFMVSLVMRTREPSWFRRRSALVAAYPHFSVCAGVPPHKLHGVAALPLVTDGQLLGALCFGFSTPQTFTRRERELVGTVAQQCAQALGRARVLEAERRACERAERASAELGRAAELREQLLAMLGHDLRTPLSAITMAADLLVRRASPQDVCALERIRRAADRMRRMVEQMLDFARIRHGGLSIAPGRTDLGALVEEIVEEVRAAHPERALACEIRGDCRGRWDGDRLGAVVSNLLGNAIRYGSEAPIDICVDGTGAQVALEVTNRGPPIASELLPVLFEPFRRGAADSVGEGLGLGLYIAREIVTRHGGHIGVTSSEAGTTFTVLLPRQPPGQEIVAASGGASLGGALARMEK